MSERTRKLALTEGVIAGTFFGTAAVFIRFLGNVDIFSIALWRLLIAAAALAVILFFFTKTFSFGLVRKNFKDLTILSVFLGFHFIFFISAVKDTTILNATVLVNTAPIFSMFISTFLFNIKPSRLAVLGLTISFLGVCIIAYADAHPFGFSLNLKGDLEAVLAAVVEAFYLNLGRKTRSQMPVLSTMFLIYLLTAVVIGVLSVPAHAITTLGIFKGNAPLIPLSILSIPTYAAAVLSDALKIILPLVGLGLLPTAIAHTLYFSSLSNLKSFETATMALLEPIGATILGILLFREIPALLFVFGAFLVLLGIFFVAKQ